MRAAQGCTDDGTVQSERGEVDDLVLGGFVIVVPARQPSGDGAGVPERILTLSHCVMDAPGHDFYGWFTDAEEAESRRREEPFARTVVVAAPRAEVETLLRECGGPSMPYFDLLRRSERLPLGAALLGYEVVGVEEPLSFHSWHCYGFPADVRDALGVHVNAHGLVDDLTDALRVRDWMLARPPDEQAPDIPWVVVALVEYPVDRR